MRKVRVKKVLFFGKPYKTVYFKNWCLCVLEGPEKVIYDIVVLGIEDSIKKAKGHPQNMYYHT